jgi:hypothetical protein
MNLGRQYFSSVVLPNGEVFVVGDGFGDNSPEIYNSATNVWTLVAPGPAEAGAQAEVLPDGNVLVGALGENGTEIYHPATNTWSAGGDKV